MMVSKILWIYTHAVLSYNPIKDKTFYFAEICYDY